MDETSTVLWSMLLICIALIMFIYAICTYCYQLPYNFTGTVSDWISAMASIFGGMLTLIGVYWTIVSERVKRKEDMALLYRPILQYEISDNCYEYKQCSELNFMFDSNLFDNNDYHWLKDKIIIKNIGRGEAYGLSTCIKKYSVIATNILDYNNNDLIQNANFIGNNYINYLPIDGEFYIMIGIPKLKLNTLPPQDLEFLINAEMEISFKGIISEEEYVFSLYFNIDIQKDKFGYQGRFFNTVLKMNLNDELKNNV